jgi:hypothetical protein
LDFDFGNEKINDGGEKKVKMIEMYFFMIFINSRKNTTYMCVCERKERNIRNVSSVFSFAAAEADANDDYADDKYLILF